MRLGPAPGWVLNAFSQRDRCGWMQTENGIIEKWPHYGGKLRTAKNRCRNHSGLDTNSRDLKKIRKAKSDRVAVISWRNGSSSLPSSLIRKVINHKYTREKVSTKKSKKKSNPGKIPAYTRHTSKYLGRDWSNVCHAQVLCVNMFN